MLEFRHFILIASLNHTHYICIRFNWIELNVCMQTNRNEIDSNLILKLEEICFFWIWNQMNGYSRLGRGKGSSSSSPSSSSSSCSKSKESNSNSMERLVFLVMSAVFRRRGLLLFAPLLYISGMLLYMGSLSFDVVTIKNGIVVVHKRPPPGSVYRSPQVFQNLWPFMEAQTANSTNLNVVSSLLFFLLTYFNLFIRSSEILWCLQLMKAWNIKEDRHWKPCANRTLLQRGPSFFNTNSFWIVSLLKQLANFFFLLLRNAQVKWFSYNWSKWWIESATLVGMPFLSCCYMNIAVHTSSYVHIVLALILLLVFADMWCSCCGWTTKCNSCYSNISF